MLLLAALQPLSPPLLCTIDSVESSWVPNPNAGVRMFKDQTFSLRAVPNMSMSQHGVINSRLTSLADDLESPQASTSIDGSIRDLWSVEAPLGKVALGTGHVDQRFMLVRRSVIKARPDGGELTLQQDKAIGRCREQD